MKRLIYIIIGVAPLLFASCGPQAEAEDLVEEFMEQNMREGLKPSSVHFTDIDSTHAMTDSIVVNLRQLARQAKRYRPDLKYAGSQRHLLSRHGADACCRFQGELKKSPATK